MHVSFSFFCAERGFGFFVTLLCFSVHGGFVVNFFLTRLSTKNQLLGNGIVAFFSSIMARSPDKIKNIDGSKETLKLSMRITDLWFIGTPNKSEQAEMVFVDSDVCFNFLFFFSRFITYCSGHCVVTLTQSRVMRSMLFVNKTN